MELFGESERKQKGSRLSYLRVFWQMQSVLYLLQNELTEERECGKDKASGFLLPRTNNTADS